MCLSWFDAEVTFCGLWRRLGWSASVAGRHRPVGGHGEPNGVIEIADSIRQSRTNEMIWTRGHDAVRL